MWIICHSSVQLSQCHSCPWHKQLLKWGKLKWLMQMQMILFYRSQLMYLMKPTKGRCRRVHIPNKRIHVFVVTQAELHQCDPMTAEKALIVLQMLRTERKQWMKKFNHICRMVHGLNLICLLVGRQLNVNGYSKPNWIAIYKLTCCKRM